MVVGLVYRLKSLVANNGVALKNISKGHIHLNFVWVLIFLQNWGDICRILRFF